MQQNSYALHLLGFIFCSFSLCFNSYAQLNNPCLGIIMNIEKGVFGKFKEKPTAEAFRTTYPCFTRDESQQANSFCKGGIYYTELGMVYFPQYAYIQLSAHFRGKIVPAIMGYSPKQVESVLGTAKRQEKVQSLTGEVQMHWYYKKKYGAYSLIFEQEKVVKINIHFTKVEQSFICD